MANQTTIEFMAGLMMCHFDCPLDSPHEWIDPDEDDNELIYDEMMAYKLLSDADQKAFRQQVLAELTKLLD